MAEILKGAPVAAALDEKTSAAVNELKAAGIIPTLAILRVGEREDDLAYERGAIKRAEKVGVAVKQVLLPAEVSQEKLMEAIESLNADESVHGVLMFRPLPKTLDEKVACAALLPEKDVDGLTVGSMAGVFMNSGEGFAPCTAEACIELLDHYGLELKGKRVAVIGRSLVIGKPVSMLLLQKNATVTICHTRTVDMSEVTRSAEIVIAAAGKEKMITAEYLSEGQTIVDVGINVDESGRLCGDVDFETAEGIVKAITPVPAGVGSVTTSVLVAHTVEAAKRSI